MSTPLPARTSFSPFLKVYLEGGNVTPNGTSFPAAVQNTLRQLVGDPSIAVSSSGSGVVVGAPIRRDGVLLTPVAVSAEFSGARTPTREEWVRALARALFQTHTVLTLYPSAISLAANGYNDGADIVTAALSPSGVYSRVRIDPQTSITPHTLVGDTAPHTTVSPAAAPVPVTTVTTVRPNPTPAPTPAVPAPVPTATQTVTQTNEATGQSVTQTTVVPLAPSAPRETVVTTTRPIPAPTPGARPQAATQTVTRTSEATGRTTTTTDIVPVTEQMLTKEPRLVGFPQPKSTSLVVPVVVGVLVIGGVAYYLSTRKRRRSA